MTAHVPNTGSMKTCIAEDAPCLLTHNPDPKRKLKWTLERMVIDGAQIGVNTRLPNALVYEAWQNQTIPHWREFDRGQLEVKINDKSRLDLVLWRSEDAPSVQKLKAPFGEQALHFIEIKNVTMAENGTAYFPDAVTERGTKHISDLIELQRLGHTCEMVYVIHRENIKSFEIAKDIDPAYDAAVAKAKKLGIKITALSVGFDGDETYVTGVL